MENSDLSERSTLVDREGYIEEETWGEIVQSMPIPSVDLLVQCPEGILLGKRVNQPAKDEWFIPGGRIQKGEPRREAVHRIADEELGLKVSIEQSLGAFDHFYEKSDVSESGGKHYIAHAYLVSTKDCTANEDEQHSKIRVFESLPHQLHPHVKAYLEAANFGDESLGRGEKLST